MAPSRAADLRTLRFGPLWVLSSLAGSYDRFDGIELDAFWDTLVEVALRTPEPARGVLTSLSTDRRGLLREFAFDSRPVASGLTQLVAALERAGSPLATDYRAALLRIGAALARARGPHGRRASEEDQQRLQLLAALLEVGPAGDALAG